MRILQTGTWSDIAGRLTWLRRNSEAAGFSLLEIIVVIFLISMMLALVIPSFSVVREKKIKSDARRLASVLRYLNDSAISTKETFSLGVDFKEKLIVSNGPEGEKIRRFESLYAVELQSKGMVSEGELIIFFGPLGASEAFSFFLKDEGAAMTVVFNPLSGRVKVLEDLS